MAGKQNFDTELAGLEALRTVAPATAEPQLKKALGHRNNFLVAKAAALALHHQLPGLAPQLAAAFSRFLENSIKTDSQCWAKNEIVKALAAFEYQEHELFLAGTRHVQLEPSWGGTTDSAGTLRGACALALVQCRELNSHRVLTLLTPLFADKEVSVRVNAARAVEQVGTDSAALLLRLRAELGSDAPELLGACFSGVLALEGSSALPWVARFLPAEDDASAEAAMAIAEAHTLQAFQILQGTWKKARDPWFATALLSAIALTRQLEASEWLLELIGEDHPHAPEALEALCRAAPSPVILDRLRELGRSCP